MSKRIVFIHGMFMTPKSWEKWTEYFSKQGYECLAPAWPLHDGEPAELRANIPEGAGDIVLAEVVAEMERVARNCAEPPILIGHSVGGLIVQVLVNKGLASAGVAISPVAPNAMLSLEWTFLKSTVPILNPLKGNALQEMPPGRFYETFGNCLSEAESRAEWEKYAVHESRNVLRTALGEAGQVDLKKAHAPLLLVSGIEDVIIPDSLVEKLFDAYADSVGIRSLRLFPERGHHICNEPGWQEVADFVAGWLEQQGQGSDDLVEVGAGVAHREGN